MVLMGLAFGVIFPLGMVLGVRIPFIAAFSPTRPPETRNQKPETRNRNPNIHILDRSFSLARPGPSRRNYHRRPRLLPRSCA